LLRNIERATSIRLASIHVKMNEIAHWWIRHTGETASAHFSAVGQPDRSIWAFAEYEPCDRKAGRDIQERRDAAHQKVTTPESIPSLAELEAVSLKLAKAAKA